MARFAMRSAAVLLAVLAVAGCEGASNPFGGVLDSDPEFPPDRGAWQGLTAAGSAEHARAVHLALSTPGREPVRWRSGDASGAVTAANIVETGPTICRGFTDGIETRGTKSQVRDIACWGDGWFYLRQGAIPPVLGPAFDQGDRVYTVKSGGTLGAVARRTGASLEELEKLNPGYPERLSRGTRILLP